MKRTFKQRWLVNNFTNINKTNNHPSPQVTEHRQNTTTYDVGNQGPGLGRALKCGGVEPVNGIQTAVLVI